VGAPGGGTGHEDRQAGRTDGPVDPARELQHFLVELGAALNAAGEAVSSVQERLSRVAVARGAGDVRVSAFPTFTMVAMGRGEPATLENTLAVPVAPQLDQIAALDRLATEAERGRVEPGDGTHRLQEIRGMRRRFGPVAAVAGYAVLASGLCLLLRPAPGEVATAAVLGAVVGTLLELAHRSPSFRVLVPLVAAFSVSALAATAVEHDIVAAGLRAVVAPLVVFLPGATLTTAVLELTAGQVVAGASRFVAGLLQLGLLAFGIVAGIEAVDPQVSLLARSSEDLLPVWVPWAGVLVLAAGVTVANSVPARALPGLLIVLYSAWAGQVLGDALLGAYVSGLVGGLVLAPVTRWTARLPSALPPLASFFPGFWLLVPGALGLMGVAQLAGDAPDAGTRDLVGTIVVTLAVAVGVLCGSLLPVRWRPRRAPGP
jgi:uncharacterized membrane protein YjjP (DUF1212 family)